MTLDELIERARIYRMTPEEQREQRISWAWGQMAIDDPTVTREIVERAADALDAQEDEKGVNL